MERLLLLASAQGIYVGYESLRRAGYYMHAERLAVVSRDLSPKEQRIALAHALGHAHHGNDCMHGPRDVRDELEADVFAARLLITPEQYRSAELTAGHSVAAIALALSVSKRLVELRRRDLSPEFAANAVRAWLAPQARSKPRSVG